MQPTPWKKLSSTYLHQSHWLNLRADRCEISPGKVIEPYYVIETMDWVHVVAVTQDRQVILVRQFRYAGDCVSEEIPGGLRDAGEAPLETAKRELLEEAGAVSNKWIHLASLRPDPARMTNHVHTFLALDASLKGTQSLDETEDLHPHLKTFDEVDGLIDRGIFCQSTQVASYLLARRYLARNMP